ncbi:MAG: metallophosphoesterase [Bacteroidales bacterium]
MQKNPFFRKGGIIFTATLLLLPLLLPSLVYLRVIDTDSSFFMWGVFCFILFSIPAVFFLLYSGILILPVRRIKKARAFSGIFGLSCSLILFSMILYGGVIGRRKLVIQREVLSFSNLPASFDGLRIVQLSDLHLGSLRHDPEYVEAISDSIKALRPDILFFTGDLVNSRADEAAVFRSVLSGIRGKEGTFSVLGNHDYGFYYPWNSEAERLRNLEQLQKIEQDAGWQLLNNAHRYLKRGTDSIAIIGVENWGEKRFGQQGNLAKAMQGIPDSVFSLLLSHNPVHWKSEVIPQSNIELTFSGHTHAMQLQIGDYSPSGWIYPQWSGIYRDNDQYLNVNRGTGFVIFPARIGAYPEITLIELRTKKE